jgi:hypothetical protein
LGILIGNEPFLLSKEQNSCIEAIQIWFGPHLDINFRNAERGYFLHPSPITTPRDAEPQLLPLFPVSSPRVSQSIS